MTRRVLLMASSMRGGGSERQTLTLLKRIDRNKMSPHLFLTNRDGDLLDEVPADVPIHSFDQRPASNGLYFPGRMLRQQSNHLAGVIREQQIDVVYDRTFHMTMIADPACQSTGTPRISTIVSPPDRALPMVESRFVSIKRQRLAKAYRRSQKVIAVSHQAAKSACDYYHLWPDHVQVIHNPIDIEATRQQAASMSVSRDERLTLVCVGRMTAEKGHRDLIQAIARCEADWPTNQPPITLWMVGDGPLRGELQTQWDEVSRGLHTIEFKGSQHSAAPYIEASDALVLPSLFEGLPNVVLEAMALETPVIATRAGGTIELEADDPTILWAEPGNSQSIAAAIRNFAEDRHAAIERVRNACGLLLVQHDIHRITQQIQALLLRAT